MVAAFGDIYVLYHWDQALRLLVKTAFEARLANAFQST